MTKLFTFKIKSLVPPGGSYFYTTPDTGQYFESRVSLSDCMRKVEDHYAANSIPTPANLKDMIVDYICRNSPPGFCEGGDGTENKYARLDFFAVQRYTDVFINKLKSCWTGDDFFVSQDEAIRRAKICIGCRMNVRKICTTCNGLRDYAARLIANRKTPYDSWLGACGDCGCVLTAKIHVASKYLKKDITEDTPAICWVRS